MSMRMWRTVMILLLTTPVTTENAITYKYLRKDFRILHIRCSSESQALQITVSNCTSKDTPPTKLAWVIDSKPERGSYDRSIYLATDTSKDTRSNHLDIVMTEYDPSVDQRFCCVILCSKNGDTSEIPWNITVTKAASHENDECSDYKTAIIALATVLALVLIIFMLIVILVCRHQSRCVKTYKKLVLGNKNESLNTVPPSYTTACSDIHPQEPIYQQEPAYSICNLNRSQNNLYKTKSQQSSLQRSNTRQNGRISSSRPSLPPPMASKKEATLRRTFSVTSNRSRIPYCQPQDAVGQMIRENEEVPDNDVSSDGANLDFRYAIPRRDEKRLSCSL